MTSSGRFQIGFNDAEAGAVRVTEQQAQTEDGGAEPTAGGETEPAAQTEPAIVGEGGGLGPLPATVMGVSTTLVLGGLAGALLLFGVVIAALWRGGSRNDSEFEL